MKTSPGSAFRCGMGNLRARAGSRCAVLPPLPCLKYMGRCLSGARCLEIVWLGGRAGRGQQHRREVEVSFLHPLRPRGCGQPPTQRVDLDRRLRGIVTDKIDDVAGFGESFRLVQPRKFEGLRSGPRCGAHHGRHPSELVTLLSSSKDDGLFRGAKRMPDDFVPSMRRNHRRHRRLLPALWREFQPQLGLYHDRAPHGSRHCNLGDSLKTLKPSNEPSRRQ
jgi:hypothetical protein